MLMQAYIIRNDGTASIMGGSGVYRFSATNCDGDPVGLLQEIANPGTGNMPWVSLEVRDTALKVINTIPVDDVTRTLLVKHVRGTGYKADDTVQTISVSCSAGAIRDFTGPGIACWGVFDATSYWMLPRLINGYLDVQMHSPQDKYKLSLPFESLETRDKVLAAIVECPTGECFRTRDRDYLPELDQKTRTLLINAVKAVSYVAQSTATGT